MGPRWVLLSLLILVGCVRNPTDIGLKVTERHNVAEPKIEYLGVGGWLLHWRGGGAIACSLFQ